MQAPYPEDDIRHLYQMSRFKKQEIRILAELCDSTTRYIEGVVGLKKPIPYERGYYHSKVALQDVNYAKLHELLKDPAMSYEKISNATGASKDTILRYYRKNENSFPERAYKSRKAIV